MNFLEIIEYVKAAGGLAAPIFFILWWLERDERRSAQSELKEISEKTILALQEIRIMVGQLISIFDRKK